jgi:hypothetical protein
MAHDHLVSIPDKAGEGAAREDLEIVRVGADGENAHAYVPP